MNIVKAVSRIGETNGTKNPDSKNNVGNYLGDIYLWQVVGEIAADRLKAAWNYLNSDKLMPDDDHLRANVEGEIVALKSPTFALQVKVAKPRESFDKDLFIEKASKRFKIDKHKLLELSMECTKQSKAPLTKKVLELK
jgi:hypothetical protein